MRHRWPFSVHRFLYVAIDESAKLRPLLCREVLAKDNDSSECAGLCGHCELGLIEVIPDLDRHENNKQAEDDPKRWQHSRRERLERTSAAVIHREPNHCQIDAGSNKVGGRKDDKGHPRYRKREKPIAHDPHPIIVKLCRFALLTLS